MIHRQSLQAALASSLEDHPETILLGEDIRDPYGGAFKVTRGLSTRYPDRVINTPISEASIMGVATGAALRGLRPILEIMFSDFLTLCADQVVNHASKFSSIFPGVHGLPLLVRAPTGGYRGYGPTHSQTMEKLFFGFPGLTIVAPSEFHDPGNLLKESLASRQLTLFVEHKLLYGCDLVDSRDGYHRGFRLSREIGEGPDDTVILTPCEVGERPSMTIVTYGGISSTVLAAARAAFIDEEIACEIVVPARIQPLGIAPMIASARKTGRVIVVEESHLGWGWGAEVATQIMQHCFSSLRAPVARVAALNEAIPCARMLENAVLPQLEDIDRAIQQMARTA